MVQLPIWCHKDDISKAVRNYLAEFSRNPDEFKRDSEAWVRKAEKEMKTASNRGTG